MAEISSTPLKRQRAEEEQENLEEQTKLQKTSSPSSYNQIVSLLEETEDQEEPNHDLNSLITTLQQEISSADPITACTEISYPEKLTASSSGSSSSSSSSSLKEDDEENDKERVMRRLLEASDDELGIPNTQAGGSYYEEQAVITDSINENFSINGDLIGGFGPFCDGLWELEDEAANYYTLLQSELFM